MLAMDNLITGTNVTYRALTNPSFMDNMARQAESIKNQGVFFSPIAGDRKLPAVATHDIAATASRLLLDKSWSGVDEVPLLGPEDLSFNDMAEIISEVLGTQVRFQQATLEAYKDRLVRRGMSEAMAQGMTDMAAAKNEGIDNAVHARRRTRHRRASANGAKRCSRPPSPTRQRRQRPRATCGLSGTRRRRVQRRPDSVTSSAVRQGPMDRAMRSPSPPPRER